MTNLLIKEGKCNSWKKYFRCFAVSTCPPGQVLAGPDMSDFRLLIKFLTFRVQKKDFDEIYKCHQNNIFGSETCEIRPKVGNRTCPDLPRPVLLSKFIIFYKIHRFY